VLALLHGLTDPWADPLLRRAYLEVALLGVAGGALGCWIVHYRLAYSAESLAHAMLPGLVVAALLGLPLLLGGAAGLLVAALAVALAGRAAGPVSSDVGVAIAVTTLFGLGALLALSADSPPGLDGLLFGDVLGVSDGDLWLAGGLVVALLVVLGLAHHRLLAVGLDRLSAPALGLSPLRMDVLLLVALAATLLVAVQGLGNLLVVAVLVAPPLTAARLTRRMGPMIAVSALIAVLGGWGGLYLSYHAGIAAGASVAGVLCLLALLSFAVRTPRTGRGARSRARRPRTSPAPPDARSPSPAPRPRTG
jgi:ABC-type Mn2+/Zn2+ transport system permease subunit